MTTSETCPQCGRINRPGSRFCASCRTPLTGNGSDLPTNYVATGPPCPKCGTVNPRGALFCYQCGGSMRPVGPTPQSGTGALPPDTTFQNGRYRVESLLGQGGMGAVYVVRDTRLHNKQWALKEMSTSALMTTDELRQAVAAFQQEAAILANLNHRNLPRVTDHFEEGGREYLVMELVNGETLSDLLTRQKRAFPVDQVLTWAAQLCDVLGYLHEQKPPIIFRDLKPSNIMLDEEGRIKLIDFGIARHFKPGKKADTAAFGTAGYAPPEQFGRGQTDPRSDIYSLAATLHQLLTLRDPSPDPFNFPPARQLNRKIPEGLSAALAKALEPSPGKRWPSMAAFDKALQEGVRADSQQPVQPVAQEAAAPRSQVRAAPAPAPAAPVQVAQPKPAEVAAPPARRRAGLLGYLVVVALLGGLSALMYRHEARMLLDETLGDPFLVFLLSQALIWFAPVFGYLITRRPLAAFLIFSLGRWIGMTQFSLEFGDSWFQEMLISTLIVAATLEAVFLLSRYRTRGVLVGVVAAVAGAVASLVVPIALGMGFFDQGYEAMAQMLFAALVGGSIAALLAKLLRRG